MQGFIDFITGLVSNAMQTNQFFSGGLLLMILGSIGGLVWRAIPPIKRALKKRYLISIDIRDNEVFRWIGEWLEYQNYGERCQLLAVGSYDGHDGRTHKPLTLEGDNEQSLEDTIVFAPGQGSHYFKYKGRWVWLQRVKEEIGKLGVREYYSLTTYGRDPTFLKGLIKDAAKLADDKKEDRVKVYIHNDIGDWWYSTRTPRPLDSIILPDDQKKDIVDDMREFFDKRSWYTKRGIPWRRGYLFYGPPGNGKSSLSFALASEFNMNLYSLSLSSDRLSDTSLLTLINGVQPRSLLMIEDIDKAFREREKTDNMDNVISFSGLLNALDGVASEEGRIVIMTTNHPQHLDDALIRPGRVDRKFFFGNATENQVSRMFEVFYPDASNLLRDQFISDIELGDLPVAAIQNHFLANDTAKEAVDGVGNINENDFVWVSEEDKKEHAVGLKRE